MRNQTDRVEFYLDKSLNPMMIHDGSFQPEEGDLINILGTTYQVIGRSFTIDRAGSRDAVMRCNVILRVVE